MTRVLVIEDEPATQQVLVDLLTHLGYETVAADSGASGLELASQSDPGLILLDLGLPDVSGMEVIRQLRTWNEVPVIVVSGSTRNRRKADALDAGADDFLDKPFNVSELRARIRVAERRLASSQADATSARAFDGLVIDALSRSVTRDGSEVRLTETEWQLVDQLSGRPGRVLTHRWLIKQVWGPHVGAEAETSLRQHVRSVRAKIGDDAHEPRYIRTESGVGYRWIGRPSAVGEPTADPLTLATEFVHDLQRSMCVHGHTASPELRALTEQIVATVAQVTAAEVTA